MIGLVLVTHGRLAVEFITALEHVVGPQQGIEPICIGPDDDMEKRRGDIAEAIERVNEGDGVIILTDLFGGSRFPSFDAEGRVTITLGTQSFYWLRVAQPVAEEVPVNTTAIPIILPDPQI